MTSRFEVIAESNLPASHAVDLLPGKDDEPLSDEAFRSAIETFLWADGMTRTSAARAVRAVASQAHSASERHWKAAIKIIAYLKETKELGLMFVKGEDLRQ